MRRPGRVAAAVVLATCVGVMGIFGVPGGAPPPPPPARFGRAKLPKIKPMELSVVEAREQQLRDEQLSARTTLAFEGEGGAGVPTGRRQVESGDASWVAPSTHTPAVADATDFRSRRAVVFIDIPHNGGATLDATFGGLKRIVQKTPDLRRPVDPLDVAFLVADSYPDARALVDAFGTDPGLRHIAPDAEYVIAMSIRSPVYRVVDAFNRATLFAHTPSFPCDAFSSAKRDPQHRALVHLNHVNQLLFGKEYITCQRLLNLQVKALVGAPRNAAVTEEHLAAAKQVIASRNVTVFLEDDPEKSMYALWRKFRHPPIDALEWHRTGVHAAGDGDGGDGAAGGGPASLVVPLDAIPQNVRDILYRENYLDAQLTHEAVQRFWTDWAGAHEAAYDPATPCAEPSVCWEEDGAGRRPKRVELKSLKRVPVASARLLRLPYCAALCKFEA